MNDSKGKNNAEGELVLKKEIFAILLALQGLVAVARDAVPSAMRDVAPGEIRPAGWLREMANAVRDGYTARMDEVDEEFRRAWGPDFRPRGDKVHWSRRQGSWPSEGGAYWFEALSLLAFQIDDPELKRLASNRIETVIARINPESWGFLWWMDRRNREDVAALKGDPFLLRNSERLTTALCQWYRATGDRRIPEALRVAYAPAAFDLTRPFVGGYEAWQVTRDEPLARLLDANVGRLGDDYRVKLYWNAPDAGLAKTLSLKYVDERRLKLPTRHGYDVTSSLMIHLRAYQWSGDVRRIEVARKWLDFFGANCRMPFGQIVKDEEWGWPGAYRAVETCTAARENQVYLAYLAALGEGRWGDEVEEAVFNIAVNAMSADCTEHVYLQQPNRLRSDDLGQCSHAGDPDLDGVMVRHGEYRRKHYPLCCTAGLNLFWPNFIQNLWLLPGDGGLAAALYSPCTLDTALGGGRVRVKEETGYPFAETVRFTFEAVPGGRFPLRLRLPRWCAKPQATVNGASVALAAEKGFARIDRAWKAGDVVALTLPMAPRLERMRDMNPTASGGAAVDYGYFKLGPLLFAENLPSAGLNAAPADVCIPTLAADAAAKVVRTGKSLGWKNPAEAPVRLVTRTADGQSLELVPYGSAKFRISMFPIAGK